MKKITLLFAVIISSSCNIFAQHERAFEAHEEILQKKLEYIKSKLQLTAEEEKNFIPVYIEFENKRNQIIKDRHKIFRKFNENSLNLSEAELQKMNADLVSSFTDEAKLFEEYNTKFKTLLSPVKLMLLYISEHEFKKVLIKKINNTQPGR